MMKKYVVKNLSFRKYFVYYFFGTPKAPPTCFCQSQAQAIVDAGFVDPAISILVGFLFDVPKGC